MDTKLETYKDYCRTIKWYLIVMGLWPELPLLFRIFLSSLTSFSLLILFITFTNFCFQNVSNVMILTKGMSLMVSWATALLKVYIFLYHYDEILYLKNHLDAKFTEDLKNDDYRVDLLKQINIFNNLLIVYTVSSISLLSVYIVKPLYVLFKYNRYSRMYPVVYPFSYESGGIVYWCLYLFEVIGSLSMMNVSIGVDCTFALYSLQMSGELRLLGKRFENLQATSNFKKDLSDCISRHHLLMKAKVKLESFIGFTSLWLIVSGALVLCSQVFQVAEARKNGVSVAQACHMSIYLIPKFLQIFTYAWNGHIISEESDACLNSIYNSNWPESSNMEFKKNMLIIMAQKPFILFAKGCMIIRLDIFTKIVNTSVSYFFLLQALNDGSAEKNKN